MTHQTTTYNNSGNTFLPLREVRRVFFFLIMMVMGVGSAWADTWDGSVAAKIATGNGSQATPYVINSAAEFAYFGKNMNGKTWYVKLGVDIDLNNIEWTYGKNNATNFKGHFNGGGHTISNLKIVPVSAKNNGFFSSLEGAAASRAEVKDLIIDGVTISQTGNLAATTTSGALAGNVTAYTDITNVTVKKVSISFANLTNANYVGGFVGRVEKNNSTITDCSVENPSIEVTGNISGGASFIGGAIGDVIGSNNLLTTINGLTVTSPTVTIDKVSVANCYIGAVFGRINNYSAVDDVTVSQPELLYKNGANTAVAINLGSFAGGIAGIANPSVETAVTNVTVTSAKLTLGTENNSYVMQNVNAGLIGQASTNVRLEGWTVDDTNVQVNTRFTNASSTNRRIGAFAGYLVGTSAAPLTTKDITVNSSTINVKANLEATTYIGGFAGVATTNAFITNCTSKNSTVTVEKDMTTGASYIGGAIGDFVGGAGNISTINGLTVTSPTVTINKVSVANCYIGGVFGRINTYSAVDDVTVSQPELLYKNGANTAVAINLGSFAGGIAGIANPSVETAVTNVTVTSAKLTLGTENNSYVMQNVNAGLIGQASTNVRLEGWTVDDTNVQVNTRFTNASSTYRRIGAFAGYLAGANAASLTAKDITVNSSTINVNANLEATTYIGGFAGQASTSAFITNCTSKNSTVTVEKDMTVGASYIGGAIGDFLGGAGNISTINGLTVENPSVTVNKNSIANSNVGGVFGRIGNYSIVNGVTAKSPSVTYNNDGSPNFALNIGSFAGYILGSAQQETVVTRTKVEGTAQVTIDDEANKAGNIITNIKAGLNGQVSTNVRLDDWTIENTSVKANGNLGATSGTTASYIGGFAGYMVSAANSPLNISGITISGNSNVDISGNIAIDNCYLGGFAGDIYNNNTNYAPINIDKASIEGTSTVHIGGTAQKKTNMGGFAGYINGTGKVGSTITANNVTLKNANVSIDGETAAECRYGAMVGGATTGCNFNGWKVQNSAKVTIGDNITNTCYIGGGFGSLEGSTNYPAIATDINIAGLDISLNSDLTTTLYVGGVAGQLTACATTPNKIEKAQASGNISIISITGRHTFANSNKTYAFGGIVGYTGQSATNMSEINQCISEVNFDLSGLTPATAGNLYQNGLVVGGVIGRINTPGRLPEQLYYSGKIYAPYAAVGPIVGVFLTKMDAAAYVYNDYAGINASNVTNEWAKADTWFYNGYKIGLTSDVMSQSVNYTGTPVDENGINYLLVGECATTFSQQNKIGTDSKMSYTILSYDHDNNVNESGAIYPQWNKNVNTYPAYYMYYMQGVNRGTYTATPVDIKKAILAGTLTIMTLVDNNGDLTNKDNRGFVSHEFIATTSSTVSIDSYNWYVNGEQKQTGTSNTFNYTPDIAVNTVAVEAIKGSKVVKRLECKVMPVFRVQYVSEALGTSSNPYLIGSAQDLQLLSYLSTLPSGVAWEKDYDSYTHYNKAYYKMDGDVDLSAIDDFAPIGLNKATYSQNYIFDGVFDGDRHTISGLKETWYGGIWNTDDYNVGWGLFAYVGNPNATVKVGDTSASNTVIKNLIIDGATLTHDPNNTSFYYNSGTSGKTNNCMVGVLAGIVSSNTTIQNIEIRNSKITDEGSSNYNLATRGLFVGGAIGSLQNAFNATANSATNTKIDHIAAQVDITLEHPTFADATATGQLGLFNIGGIIGRYCATSATQDQAQANMPAYTFYSGSINASKAWISPVLGALRYAGQYSVTWANYSKIWEGNNNSTATQITITNAQYYNFRINGELMTTLFPENACVLGARPIMTHTDATEAADTYNAQKYQGVNYNARFIDSDGTTLMFLNENATDGIYWKWDNGFPHLTDVKPTNESYLTQFGNDFTANMLQGSGSSYRWEASFDGATWVDIPGETGKTNSVAAVSRKLIVAIVTVGGEEYRTQAELATANVTLVPYIEESGDDDTGYTFTLVWKGYEPSGTFTPSYQWYHSDQTTPFDGATGTSLSLTKDQLTADGGMVWCKIVVKELGVEAFSTFVNNKAVVVYVNGNNYTGSDSNGAYGVGDDANNGMTPQTPVKTIDKANSLLDGGPWEKNIIVVMGTLNPNDKNYFRSKGKNPATLTGEWNGTNYDGVIIIQKADGDGLNPGSNPDKNCYVLGDTKFQYLTFQGKNNTDDNYFIECHGNNVTFGKGLVMTNFANLSISHSNMEAKQNVPELTIVLTATNIDEATIRQYTNRTTPQVVTFESGHYGRIMGGRYTNGFFSANTNTSHTILGSAEHPIWAIVNIDIDEHNQNKGTVNRKEGDNQGVVTDNFTCDINCIVAGLTDGTMWGDYQINVHGGKVDFIVGGNQGNPVPNGTATFIQVGGKSGTWGQWPNTSYFGRTVINVEQGDNMKEIKVGNLYAGGLGRSANGDKATSIIDMYIYGHTEVNMKSGTIEGNIYGGGAGGVIGVNPWDAHVPYATTAGDNDDSAIINGVQYGDNRVGSWSSMTTSSPLATVTLHNSDGNGGYTEEKLNFANSSTTLNISGGLIKGNVFGGGCGFVSNMPTQVCMQGVGSVFGTSNVNISGGTINGSVYGGSQGDTKYYDAVNKYGQTVKHIAELIGTVNLTIKGTPTIGGDIYGGGMGIPSKNATEEYLRIATAGNHELAGDGATDEQKKKYETDINITIDVEDTLPNNIYGGGALGAVDGTTNIVIKGGTIEGNIFGGGKGEVGHPNKAKVTGNTNVIVDKDWVDPKGI